MIVYGAQDSGDNLATRCHYQAGDSDIRGIFVCAEQRSTLPSSFPDETSDEF